MGVLKSKEKIKQADIVLYLFDINTVTDEELFSFISDIKEQNANVIPVANKIDHAGEKLVQHMKESFPESIFISAKSNTGIGMLKEKLFIAASGNKILSENIVLTNARHYSALKEVQSSLEEIKKGIENKISGDLLSLDIRSCLYYLGEITGEISNEDMLDYIFSKFCIGK